jgi:ubiquinone/menaquinone biosynthesis C-methylase UbiE
MEQPGEVMATQAQQYPLGHSEREGKRLARQGAQVETLTETLFRRAGIGTGMRVLDIGSGVGDVALLAAKIVGSEGAVVGVEMAVSSVEAATRRAVDLGLTNVRFEQGDLADFTPAETFDAIVGRFVLSYLPDRVALLQRLLRQLRPGGIVAFQELDMTQISQGQPSALFEQARHWLLEGFAAGGTELAMGAKLHETYLKAGLPTPDIIEITPVLDGNDRTGYEDLTQALRSLLPTIERHGIAEIEDIGIDTLAERLSADAAANGRWLSLSRIVGAWARSPVPS